MKTLQLIGAAFALALAAAQAPAQVAIEARLGKHVRVGAVIPVGGHSHSYGDRHSHRHSDRHSYQRHGHGGHHPAPRVSGHWKVVYEDVTIPGYWREDHVPPRYGWIYDHCGRRWGIVDAGGCRRVWVPARCETRSRRVWVPC